MKAMEEAEIMFENKINQLLETREYIKKGDWEDLCFAMFLHYESAQKIRELRYILERKT